MKRAFYFFVTGLILFLFSSRKSNAQEDRVWIFGQGAGVDFNSGLPFAIKSKITGFGEGCASVCGADGRLLFYTEGSFVWDKNGDIMAGGTELTGILGRDYSATSSTSQGVLIVPVPDDPGSYYVFSLSAVEWGANSGRLYYSVVDMRQNNGLGAVDAARKGVLLDTLLTEHMTGVVGDRCNVWLMVCSRSEPVFKAFEITASGINIKPVKSEYNQDSDQYVIGSINISRDRKRLAIGRSNLNGGGNLELYDFNPETGKVSNQMLLGKYGYYGVCFSPDNSKLYARLMSPTGSIEQYDVRLKDALEIGNSKTLIGNTPFTGIKLGPDGKLYFQSDYHSLGIIHQPDLKGLACQMKPSGLTLDIDATMWLGLPTVVPVFKHGEIHHDVIERKGNCFATSDSRIISAQNDTSGWDYIWNHGIAGPQITADSPGLYWVSYRVPPCVMITDTFKVSFPYGVLPHITIQNNCKGALNGKAWASTYSYDTVSYQYLWQNNTGDTLSLTDTLSGISGGEYRVKITTLHCDTTLFFELEEENPVLAFSVDTLICAGDTIQLQNQSDIYFTRFSWSFDDGTNSNIANPLHHYAQAGVYRVSLVGAGDVCIDTAYQNITVDSPSGNFGYLSDRDRICQGEGILFNPQASPLTAQLKWDFTGAEAIFRNGNDPLYHAFEQAGQFPVTLTATFRACPDLVYTDTVEVSPFPLVDLGSDTMLCRRALPVVLSNQAKIQEGDQYLWSTGDTGIQIVVTHPGKYLLSVRNRQGCVNTESVTVSGNCGIDIPNVFTPNNDGANDYFFPRRLSRGRITHFKLNVLDRWGQILFETNTINGRGWDGKYNNQEQPTGIYLYLVEVQENGFALERYQGNVTLLR